MTAAGGAGGRGSHPLVVFTFAEQLQPTYLAAVDLARLRAFAEPLWLPIPPDPHRAPDARGRPEDGQRPLPDVLTAPTLANRCGR